ncbi:MAG: metal ABC transporter substrate-binding protein [Angelakisella sp.]|nr:metal ABC transporter substrate-binding protein [Angelakisella sp.]
MKKQVACLLAALLITGLLSACANAPDNAGNTDNTKKIKIVSTIFPQYDWTKQIIGKNADNVEMTLLLDNGVDLHSFQPTADDIIKISTCDLFIYVGGESDSWVESALKSASNENMVVINLLETLGDAAKAEELVEGMEADEHHHHEGEGQEEHHDEHSHEDEHQEEHDHDGDMEYDEHIWLSLQNAQTLCRHIAARLCEIDSQHAQVYTANADAYIQRLGDLDTRYHQMVESAAYNTMLFGDRFPFRYLADDYGLSYYAAFAGCSAETEASFETISFLSNKVDQLGLTSVLTIDGTQHKIAQTIIENTRQKDQRVLTLNSMQSITTKEVQNGMDYLSVMEQNLAVLRDALN